MLKNPNKQTSDFIYKSHFQIVMIFNIRQINCPEKDSVMKIVLRAGVKCTDEERLLTTLRSNKDILAQRRVAVPDPRNYRVILRETLNKMRHQIPVRRRVTSFLMFFWKAKPTTLKRFSCPMHFSLASRERPLQTINFIPKL